MSEDFVAAMRRAAAAVQSSDVAGATAIIQQALGIGGAPAEARATRLRLPLGDAVRTLREGRTALAPGRRRPAAEPGVPEGAAFLAATHAGAHGSRRYRTYVPASAQGTPRGLVLMLHGCTQTPEDFAVGTGMNRVAEAEGLVVVYPAQTRSDNSMACWNWFRPGDQARGAGEPALLAELAQAAAAAHGVPADRIFVAGLSAGGAMAAVLAGTYPDVFAAAGVHSGLAHGCANDVLSAFAAMRGDGVAGTPPATVARLFVVHGTADTTVHPSNARRIAAASRHGGELRSERGEAGGRRYARAVAVNADGRPALEVLMVEGAAHAWSGGDARGSYTDAAGPDASAEMVRFFLG
jgi:poly(hydroxyalkanoate) depolymerase family esterase